MEHEEETMLDVGEREIATLAYTNKDHAEFIEGIRKIAKSEQRSADVGEMMELVDKTWAESDARYEKIINEKDDQIAKLLAMVDKLDGEVKKAMEAHAETLRLWEACQKAAGRES